jgi:hypothetical protein
MNRFLTIIRVFILFILLFQVAAAALLAQDCALKLQEARTMFDRGRVELVPDLISPCVESGGFSREDELTAYKLLIQALLLDEKPALAEETMVEFLKKNPEYKSSAADFSGFVYLLGKYQVRPKFMISARAGLNYTFLAGRSELSLSSLPPDISYSREPLNFYAGTEALLPLTGSLSVAAGISYSSSSFVYSENMMNFGTVTYREGQSRLEIPLSAIYQVARYKGINAYARLGAGYAMNLNTDAKASYIPSDVNNRFNRTGENVNRNQSRIHADLFIHAGLGGMIKIPHGYVTAELRVLSGLRNQVIRSDPGNLEYYYFYTDDNFRVNIAGITFGYTHIFYKPVKTPGL